MKKTLFYTFLAGLLLTVTSCQTEPVLYQFTDGFSDVSFAAATAKFSMTADDGNKIVVELQRGNTKGSADINVVIDDKTDGVFQPSASVFHFNDGEARSQITFTYPDINLFGGETYEIDITVEDPSQVSPSGISTCTVKASRKLTMKSIGVGTYYSDYWEEEWPQELLKAEEADYYELPDCWVSGVPFAFMVVDGEIQWLTGYTGYDHSSYGQIWLSYYYPMEVDFDGKTIIICTSYDVPQIENSFGPGYYEIFTLPEGVTL